MISNLYENVTSMRRKWNHYKGIAIASSTMDILLYINAIIQSGRILLLMHALKIVHINIVLCFFSLCDKLNGALHATLIYA